MKIRLCKLFFWFSTLVNFNLAFANDPPKDNHTASSPTPSATSEHGSSPTPDGSKTTPATSQTVQATPVPTAKPFFSPGPGDPGYKGQPLPRKVFLPKFSFANATDSKQTTYEYEKYRYSIICVIRAEGERSANLTKLLLENYPELSRRNIGILTLFSHDSTESLKEWYHIYKPKFAAGIMNLKFIDALKNPKVPTLWLVGNKGDILTKVELPSKKALDAALAKLWLWSNF